MIRINLLPPEITQKRKDEQNWKYVLAGALVVVVLLAVFYMVVAVMVSAKQADVAAIKQEAEQAQAQTQRFQIFQEKEADLLQRKTIYEGAEKGRVDWAKLCNEIALVLPTDIYLLSLTGTEPEGGGTVAMTGKAVHLSVDDSEVGNGFKAVAKMLVRLTELSQLDHVWLTTVTHPEVPHMVDDWGIASQITPDSTATAGGVPAEPAAP